MKVGKAGKIVDPKVEALKKKKRTIIKGMGDMKTKMNAVMTAATDLFTEISAGTKEWANFNNTGMLTPLLDARSAVETFKGSSDFYKAWCLEAEFDKWLNKSDMAKSQAEFERLGVLDDLIKHVAKQMMNLKSAKAVWKE